MRQRSSETRGGGENPTIAGRACETCEPRRLLAVAPSLIAGAALVFAMTPAAEGAAIAYQVTDLGQYVTGRALNDAGQVVGSALVTPPGGGTGVNVPFI